MRLITVVRGNLRCLSLVSWWAGIVYDSITFLDWGFRHIRRQYWYSFLSLRSTFLELLSFFPLRILFIWVLEHYRFFASTFTFSSYVYTGVILVSLYLFHIDSMLLFSIFFVFPVLRYRFSTSPLPILPLSIPFLLPTIPPHNPLDPRTSRFRSSSILHPSAPNHPLSLRPNPLVLAFVNQQLYARLRLVTVSQSNKKTCEVFAKNMLRAPCWTRERSLAAGSWPSGQKAPVDIIPPSLDVVWDQDGIASFEKNGCRVGWCTTSWEDCWVGWLVGWLVGGTGGSLRSLRAITSVKALGRNIDKSK